MTRARIARVFIITASLGMIALAKWLPEWLPVSLFLRNPDAAERAASVRVVGDLKIVGQDPRQYIRERCGVVWRVPKGKPILNEQAVLAREGRANLNFHGTPLGSASIISPDGYLLTAAHCLDDDRDTWVHCSDGLRTFMTKARVVWQQADPVDLAVLKIDADTPSFFPVHGGERAEVGEIILAAGLRIEEEMDIFDMKDMAAGRLLSIDAVAGNPAIFTITTNIPTVPGNSGGPLVGPDGRLLAVVTTARGVSKDWMKRLLGDIEPLCSGCGISSRDLERIMERDRERPQLESARGENPGRENTDP